MSGRRQNRKHNLKVELALNLITSLDCVLESLKIDVDVFELLYDRVIGKTKAM
jgi:hypothetical protein